MKLLADGSEATCETKVGEGITAFLECWANLGAFGGTVDIEKAISAIRKFIRHFVEAGDLASDHSIRYMTQKVIPAFGFGCTCVGSPLVLWNLDDFGGGEVGLIEGIDSYQYHKCGQVLKKELMSIDFFLCGQYLTPLVLYCKCKIFPRWIYGMHYSYY